MTTMVIPINFYGRKNHKKQDKKIIKRAKKHPDWYSQGIQLISKLVKKELKEKVNDVKLISVTP